MSKGMKILYGSATEVATELMNGIGMHFDRLEIAGSLRRKKPFVSDIELVGILKKTTVGLFDYIETTPTEVIIDLMEQFRYQPIKAGDKYIQFAYHGVPELPYRPNVDLFLCTPKTWGCIYMIRTGSAEFSKRMMTKKSWGGYCPDNIYFKEGRLWDGEEALDTPEEDDVFRELGIAYVKPENRSLK